MISIKILLLGRSGFIGASLYKRLTQSGAFVTAPSSQELNLESAESVETLKGTIDQDTALIYCVRSRKSTLPYQDFKRDFLIQTHFADALSRKSARYCLFLSSSSIYGEPKQNPVEEETAQNPNTLYGISKGMGEVLIKAAADKSKTPLAIMRPCMIYGPGNQDLAYGPDRFLHQILSQGKVDCFGDGSEKRDYIFIQDFVNVMMRLIEKNPEGIFNASSGEPLSFIEVLNKIKAAGCNPFIVHELKRFMPKYDLILSTKCLLQALAPLSFTAFEEGIRKTWESLREQHLQKA